MRHDPRAATDDGLLQEVLHPLGVDGDDAWLQLVMRAEQPAGLRTLGDYEILEEVRHGGQALVFHARDRLTGREVALKRMAYGLFASDGERRRFEREVDALLALQHPGVVTVYGLERCGDVDVLAMEWVDGQPLDRWAATQPTPPAGLAVRLSMFLQVCDAVQHAHERGVIHRDLKPANVLVDREGRCRVLDFGLAWRAGPAHTGVTSLAGRTIGFVGTPAYSPPESFAEQHGPHDVRCDVYALGVVLYQLLTGQRPFAADTLAGLIDQIQHVEPRRPSAIRPGVDRELDAIVATAMAKAPSRRYPTVHALAEDVRLRLAGRPVHAIAPSALYIARKWIGRHRTVTALATLLLLTAGGASLTGLHQARRIRDERNAAQSERARAERERDRADRERAAAVLAAETAQRESQKARAVADFYLDFLRDEMPRGDSPLIDFPAAAMRAAQRTRDAFAHDLAWAVEVEANLAQTFVHRMRFEEAIQLATRALELQRTLPDAIPTATGLLLRTLGESHWQTGRLDLAIDYLEQAVTTYRSSSAPLPRTLSATHHSLGHCYLSTDRPADAAEQFRAGIAVAGDEAMDNRLACLAALASTLQRLGKADEAESQLRTALVTVQQSGAEPITAWSVHTSLGSLLAERGDGAAAVEHLEPALAIATRSLPESHPERALSHFRLARALAGAGRGEAAREHFERALELEVSGLEEPISAESLAALVAAEGDLERAAALLDRARRRFAELLSPSSGKPTAATLDWLEALCRAGHQDQACRKMNDLLDQVARCAEAGGWPPPPCWPRMLALAAQCGGVPATVERLRSALRHLQQGPRGDHADLQTIADHLAASER